MRAEIEKLIAELRSDPLDLWRTGDSIADCLTAILAADSGGWRPIATVPVDGKERVFWKAANNCAAMGFCDIDAAQWAEWGYSHWRDITPPQEPPR